MSVDKFKIEFFIKLQELLLQKVKENQNPTPTNLLLFSMYQTIGNSLTEEEIKATFDLMLKKNNQLN